MLQKLFSSIMPTCHRLNNIILCLSNRFLISYFISQGQTHCYRFLNILPLVIAKVVIWGKTMNTRHINKCFNTYMYFCERFYVCFVSCSFHCSINMIDLIFIFFQFFASIRYTKNLICLKFDSQIFL